MLIRESISTYKHLDFGSIKLAFTQVCQEEFFSDVYFAANSLYFVESGMAILFLNGNKLTIKKGEIVFIKQHSKLDIQKFRSEDGQDFKSIIFYLFPDFVTEFVKLSPKGKYTFEDPRMEIIHLGQQEKLKDFCESLLPLFDAKQLNPADIREKTFVALHYLAHYNKDLLQVIVLNSKPVKIDLYEFMIHTAIYNYSVSELAKLTGRSLSAFKRDFAAVFKTSPHQWLLRRKIDYAEELMRIKKMKASEIYFMLGFHELSHFSAAFKKIKGTSPSQL
ncbi:helix-turn-helix domain-containing protein [Spirosoma litoris]